MSVFAKVLRAGEGKKVRNLAGIVPLINALEPEVSAMSDADLAQMTVEFKQRVADGEELNDLLVEAFAVVREAARRTIGQRHYDVQLMGGMALHFGWIAEMRTGEGKTLVSTLACYLNALAGEGVHVVTVNDYLARRDAEWMGRVYRFLGLEVGLVVPDVDSPEAKRAAYAADITYGTNTEFGFDYLRDNMAVEREQMVQRGHHYAIVDEVDSILIDEARTPLIISGPSDESTRLYYQFASVVRTLKRDEDYEVDEEKRTVVPTEEGIAKVERQLGVENLYDAVAVNYVHQLGKALEAKELHHRDKEYIVADGEVKIVDEFTGRILEGRRWSDGLHQAVEAKERVRIKEENHTWATVTLQNYFRMYEKLAGMTGTAETEAAEFASTYDLQVVPIPTNRPMVRNDAADLVFKSEDGKFTAVVEDIAERYETGQPVLVGTASVEKSEHLSRLLDKHGIPHTVLNAKQHTREAQIVAQAGRLHAVTVATNMAGRGVDILLGGNPEGLAVDAVRAEGLDPSSEQGAARAAELAAKYAPECAAEADTIRELGGLYVLGSERHESRRIDNQLRGRAGRQGDPGESRFFLSLEDELMRLFASGAMSWVMDRALPEDVPIEARMVSRAIERAQNTVEARNAEVRKDVLKYDEVMNEQRKVIYERRLQILDGEDLREYTVALVETTLERVVTATCPSDFAEEWDLERLVNELAQYYPTEFTVEDLEQADTVEQLVESVVADATETYERREQTMPGGEETARHIERQIMLQIIDQRWRQHLSEMDHLREGIHLRGIAQTDPLVAWQREGYELFGKLMDAIDDDYVRFVMHVQVLVEPEAAPDYSQASFEAAEDPASGLKAAAVVDAPLLAAPEPEQDAAAQPPARPAAAPAPPRPAPQPAARPAPGALSGGARPAPGAGLAGVAPTGRAGAQKVGRNDPCWCGSGKKFKLCHGSS
ncbi:MAG TPA: preprotein translocase subunit SecA [Acidimicrobiales bacterium]|nr:preprotein translocase subunit SecA [Acidimicrobiales bacterium]